MPHLLLKGGLVLIVLVGAAGACAQEPRADAVHWAYSTYFGSGWYQIDGAQDVFVLRYTPRHPLSHPEIGDDGTRRAGIEIRFPVTVGLNHFPLDDLPGSVDPKNLANVSVTPAMYMTWPANERWMLRPFAALGWGTLLSGDGSAWSYWAGVKSRFVLREGVHEIALLNSLGFVGYSPNDGNSSHFWPIMSGLEMRHPLFGATDDGRGWHLRWHLAYTFFQDDLELTGRNLDSAPVNDQWEIGASIERNDSRISWWKFEFDQLGLSYRFSTDGDLQGVGLVFSSLFDQ